jgi:hypothetical protein
MPVANNATLKQSVSIPENEQQKSMECFVYQDES